LSSTGRRRAAASQSGSERVRVWKTRASVVALASGGAAAPIRRIAAKACWRAGGGTEREKGRQSGRRKGKARRLDRNATLGPFGPLGFSFSGIDHAVYIHRSAPKKLYISQLHILDSRHVQSYCFFNYRVNFEMSHVHSYCISSKKKVHSYCTEYVLIYTKQSPRAYLFPSFWLFVREALPPEQAADLAQDHPPPAGQPRHA
jgi:hypothetical protein